MIVLLIGCGSIGKRHATNLLEIVPNAKFYILRSKPEQDDFTRTINAQVIKQWNDLTCIPDLAILASPSGYRREYLQKIIQQNIPAYIEKPLLTKLDELDCLKQYLVSFSYSQPVMMGCNLRFLPSLQLLREKIQEGMVGNICRAIFEVGQYLPTWRPEQNYQTSYSAKKEAGGGVIFDLVHELDLVRFLLGEFEVSNSLSARLSHLEIDSPDTAVINLTRRDGPFVSVHLDYISRSPTRNIKIVGDKGTLIWDLIAQQLQFKGPLGLEILSDVGSDFAVQETYKKAMQELMSAIEKRKETSQGFAEGIATTHLMLECDLKGNYTICG